MQRRSSGLWESTTAFEASVAQIHGREAREVDTTNPPGAALCCLAMFSWSTDLKATLRTDDDRHFVATLGGGLVGAGNACGACGASLCRSQLDPQVGDREFLRYGSVEPPVLLVGLEGGDGRVVAPREIVTTSGRIEAGRDPGHISQAVAVVAGDPGRGGVLFAPPRRAVANPVPYPPLAAAADASESLPEGGPLGVLDLLVGDPRDRVDAEGGARGLSLRIARLGRWWCRGRRHGDAVLAGRLVEVVSCIEIHANLGECGTIDRLSRNSTKTKDLLATVLI
jgi:hypothetical protein